MTHRMRNRSVILVHYMSTAGMWGSDKKKNIIYIGIRQTNIDRWKFLFVLQFMRLLMVEI